MDRPSYFSIVPPEVRYDKTLSSSEKLMYSEISALSQKNGYCNASNRYFSSLYEVHSGTVSRWLKNLQEAGHVDVYRDEFGNRNIKVKGVNKNVNSTSQKCEGGINKNVKHNNTRRTNKYNKGSGGHSMSAMIDSDSRFNELSSVSGMQDSLDTFEAHRSEIRKPMTTQARVLMLGKLVKYKEEGHDVCEIVDKAVEMGWVSVYPPKEKAKREENVAPIRGGVL